MANRGDLRNDFGALICDTLYCQHSEPHLYRVREAIDWLSLASGVAGINNWVDLLRPQSRNFVRPLFDHLHESELLSLLPVLFYTSRDRQRKTLSHRGHSAASRPVTNWNGVIRFKLSFPEYAKQLHKKGTGREKRPLIRPSQVTCQLNAGSNFDKRSLFNA